jgi:hypothetical protein
VNRVICAEPTAVRGDQQDAQLGDPRVLGERHAQDAAHPPAVDLRDPALRAGVRCSQVVGDDVGHQRLEGGVPAELLGVHLAVLPQHPAQVARLVGRSDRDTHARTSN